MKTERLTTALEFRQEGRELHGVVLQEGRAATGGRAEVFAPNSIEWPASGIDILPEHRGQSEVKVVPERQDDGRITVRAAATDVLRKAYAEGRKYLSVEFHALREIRTQGGVREIQKAMVLAAAMVRTPEYNMATAEVRGRGGRTLSSVIPADTDLECACVGGGCEFIRISQDLMAEMWDKTFQQFERQAVATYSDYRTALASTSRGTLRGRIDENGDGVVDIDIPTGAAGDAVIAAHDDAGVVVRPFVDTTTATGRTVVREDGTSVFEYDNAEVRAFIVSATDARKGWPDPRIIPTPDELMDGERSALVTPAWKRRAALWL